MKNFINNNKTRLAKMLIVILFVSSFFCIYFSVNSKAFKTCTIEAGSSVSAPDLLKEYDANAYFTDDSDTLCLNIPGEYNMTVMSKKYRHKVKITVIDTTLPSASPNHIISAYNVEHDAIEFVTDICDNTSVTASFASDVDFKKVGTNPVSIILTDLGGNSITVNSYITIFPVYESVTYEAGVKNIDIRDFYATDAVVSTSTNLNSISLNEVKSNDITFMYDSYKYNSKCIIEDTVAPSVGFRSYSGYIGENITPAKFVTSCTDETSVSYNYIREPDVTKEGFQTFEISATDEGGNTVSAILNLTLRYDTTPPVIKDVHDITVPQGNSVSYLNNVTVSDNCPDNLKFEVDSSKVNLQEPGTYPVTYKVTDVAGNIATASANVIVEERVATIEDVNEKADEILAEILTDGMNDYEKSYAIFMYLKRHIRFYNYSDKTSYVKSAYQGLFDNSGDCYVYACASQSLLTRAGIKNMMIERIPTETTHFWNLVDYGEGWYHFDTCPRSPDYPSVFMWTEQQIQNCSESHHGCYNYDHSIYPVTN